jgi:hypothetical protein
MNSGNFYKLLLIGVKLNINKIRITNLKHIISEDYDNSIHAFAKKIGRHSSQFYNLFKGDRSFGQKLARDLELLLHLPPLSLDKSPDEKTIIDKIVLIPPYPAIVSTLATPAIDANSIFAIEKAIIEHYEWPVDKLHGVIMGDESMAPTIPSNSKVLIDISQVKISDGKIYALSSNGKILIKRVFRKPNDCGYAAKSDNTHYSDIHFEMDKEFNVIGRVLCLLNQML